jgi:hypothetical protein
LQVVGVQQGDRGAAGAVDGEFVKRVDAGDAGGPFDKVTGGDFADRVQQQIDGVTVDIFGEAIVDGELQRGNTADGKMVDQCRRVVADGEFDLALQQADRGVPERKGRWRTPSRGGCPPSG